MSLTSRVGRLESMPGACPTCGAPRKIKIVEVVLPGPPLDSLLACATAAERATVERLVEELRRRAAATGATA
jgi:hypothetical protein